MNALLRWYGIDVSGGRFAWKATNFYVSEKELNLLHEVRRTYGVTLSKCIRVGMWNLKQRYLRSYQRWLGDKPVSYKPHLREFIDDKAARVMSETGFKHLPLPKLDPIASRRRINVKIRSVDLDFIKSVKISEFPMGRYFRAAIAFARLSLFRYCRHGPTKISMGIREDDYEHLNEVMRRYRSKYLEKISRSEVMKLAYFRFRLLSKKKRESIISREKQDKSRGSFKKVSLSLAFEGWEVNYDVKVLVPELRASLYYILRGRKLEEFLSYSEGYCPP